MKQLWKKFDKLSDDAYMSIARQENRMDLWDQGFETLLEIIRTGRAQDPGFARELIQLDDDTDFAHNVCDWLADYLDELDEQKQYEKLEDTCRGILELFDWKADSPSDIRFQISLALRAQGKKEEALDFCRDWYGEEPDNTLAGAALIYCLIESGDMDEAEEIVGRCIGENTACDDNNDVIFMAAIALCRAKGDKEREESLAGRLKIYEKEVEALLTGGLDFNGDEEWF